MGRLTPLGLQCDCAKLEIGRKKILRECHIVIYSQLKCLDDNIAGKDVVPENGSARDGQLLYT